MYGLWYLYNSFPMPFNVVIIYFLVGQQGMMEDLASASSGAVVLLQASGHNPTGVDPTLQQWEQIRQLMRLKGLLPYFDCAYQVSNCLVKA